MYLVPKPIDQVSLAFPPLLYMFIAQALISVSTWLANCSIQSRIIQYSFNHFKDLQPILSFIACYDLMMKKMKILTSHLFFRNL